MEDVNGYDTMEEMITFRQWSLQCFLSLEGLGGVLEKCDQVCI